MDDPISAHYAHVHIHHVLNPFPASPSTTHLIAAVNEVLSFVNLFLTNTVTNAPAYFLPQLNSLDTDERAKIHELAIASAEEMSEWLEKCEKRQINSVSCKSLFSAMGVEHKITKATQRFYLKLRMDPDVGEWPPSLQATPR